MPDELTEEDRREIAELIERTQERHAAQAAASNGSQSAVARLRIPVTTKEHVVNDAAVEALRRDDSLYQRGGLLVHVVRIMRAEEASGIYRPAGSPRIVTVPAALLRERLTRVAKYVKVKKSRNNEQKDVPTHPPAWCVRAVEARSDWPGIRHLAGIVDFPVLRPDGTILDTVGYDAATGLIYLSGSPTPSIPTQPTQQDVADAVALLLDLVADFPFEKPVHRAAWLAYLLTALCRHAFDGPAPLTLVDSNVRAAGKGLLCWLVSMIVTGRPLSTTTAHANEDEMRKAITAAALAGDALITIDNVLGQLGCASLDAALTTTRWRDRLLGRNVIVDAPLLATWAATGNNVILRGDLARRIMHVRLHSPEEHPEDRTGFRHHDIRDYAEKFRPQLLAATLTILRGYYAAGRPDMHLTPWGSYEAWSGLVRSAVVWAGLPDPSESRIEIRQTADPDAMALPALLAGIERLDTNGHGLTVAQILDKSEFSHDETIKAMREALKVLCPGKGRDPLASPQSIGMKLHHLRGRVIGAKYLDRQDSRLGARWRVISMSTSAEPCGTSGCCGTNPSPVQNNDPPDCGTSGASGTTTSPAGNNPQSDCGTSGTSGTTSNPSPANLQGTDEHVFFGRSRG
jgi:hypothetical protein